MTQAGDTLHGMCYSEGCLYVTEGRWESVRYSLSLSVYRVQSDGGHITRLDTLTGLGMGHWNMVSLCPRMDHHSHRVFVSCQHSGVTVARLDGDRLVRERTLTCVRNAISVGAMSPDNVYVGDYDNDSVHVVDIRDDRKTATLEKPATLWGERPDSLAVLGDSVMVCYGYSTLAMYRHGSLAPVRVIAPGGLERVTAISTDFQSNYIVTDETRSVFIIDNNGDLRYTANIPHTDSEPRDCAVVNRQLWVGCLTGDIVIISSQ